MDITPLVFYFFSALVVISALGVILFRSPIYSALSLAMTMLVLSGIFFLLGAQFLAAVQLMVYAGAVVVLFVMVLMLFDLRRENMTFSGTLPSVLLKVALSILGLIVIIAPLSMKALQANPKWLEAGEVETIRLAESLFTKHVFTFEIIGVLLTVVLIGAVTLAKSKGGTHAKHE